LQKTSKDNGFNKMSDLSRILVVLFIFSVILIVAVQALTLGKVSKILSLYSESLNETQENREVESVGQEKEYILRTNPVAKRMDGIYEKIMNREIVFDDLLIGVPLSAELLEDISEYNGLVRNLKGFFSDLAVKNMIALFELPRNPDGSLFAPDYRKIPEDVREYVEVITDLSLYKNSTELLCSDSRLAFIIYSEGGGSAGMWPYFWHTELIKDRKDIQEDLNRLFELTEKIILSLDEEYEKLYSMN
jgi:hypothetical protein